MEWVQTGQDKPVTCVRLLRDPLLCRDADVGVEIPHSHRILEPESHSSSKTRQKRLITSITR